MLLADAYFFWKPGSSRSAPAPLKSLQFCFFVFTFKVAMGRKRQQTPFRKTVGTSVKSTKEPEKIEENSDRDDMNRQMMQMMAKFQKFMASESQQAQKNAPKKDQGNY